VMARFHYALRPGGVLFLGRSESLLARSRLFVPAHLKWRIFYRAPTPSQPGAVLPDRGPEAVAAERQVQETSSPVARLHGAIDALPAAVAIIDLSDTILFWNGAAQELFEVPVAGAVGRKFRDLDVSYRVEGLRARIEDVKARHSPARLDDVSFARRNGEVVHADVSILPVADGGRTAAILVFAAEASEHVRLKEQMNRLAEQHATAIEELQSTNEELETTNEELQSTNEELETTNEELQSTNEELETTVEELQATNAELATLNSELEHRTAELRRLDSRHTSLLNGLGYGIVMLDRQGIVEAWNEAAQRMWGLRPEQVVGRNLGLVHLDFVGPVRQALERVLRTAQAVDIPDIPYAPPDGVARRASLHMSPLTDNAGGIIGAVGVLTPQEPPTT